MFISKILSAIFKTTIVKDSGSRNTFHRAITVCVLQCIVCLLYIVFASGHIVRYTVSVTLLGLRKFKACSLFKTEL